MKRSLLISATDQIELSIVESENPVRDCQITDNPVEFGVNISDHVKPEILIFNISGAIIGSDAGAAYSKLVGFRDKGEILFYSGRILAENLVISNLSTSHDKDIRNGFKFTITFKQLRIIKNEFENNLNQLQSIRKKSQIGKQTLSQASIQDINANQKLNKVVGVG